MNLALGFTLPAYSSSFGLRAARENERSDLLPLYVPLFNSIVHDSLKKKCNIKNKVNQPAFFDKESDDDGRWK